MYGYCRPITGFSLVLEQIPLWHAYWWQFSPGLPIKTNSLFFIQSLHRHKCQLPAGCATSFPTTTTTTKATTSHKPQATHKKTNNKTSIIMATQEARALLAELMGPDRNAPLPKGAALPHQNLEDFVIHKRVKSCYDPDIDPLYTAWGVDVYDLFVNTKSDLGPNPYVVDDAARNEYLQLPSQERDRLGFDYFLFQKLTELVKSCDRTVHRNQEKLQQELQRKLSTRADYVEDVDEAAVEALCRSTVQAEQLETELYDKLKELETLIEKETANKSELEPLLEQAAAVAKASATKATHDGNEDTTAGTEPTESSAEEHSNAAELTLDQTERLQQLQLELGQLTMDKQRVVHQVAGIVNHLSPVQESVASQKRNLWHVRSDLSTDKTVCEVSGNFLSARDADERIAAHYAGKQYVGWKLVRDKHKELIKTYGRYGPPPPAASARGPPPGAGVGSFAGRGRGGGGYGGRPPPPSAGRDRGRYDGGGGGGGGGAYGGSSYSRGDRGGGPDRGRWERHGPPPPSHGSRHDGGGRRR